MSELATAIAFNRGDVAIVDARRRPAFHAGHVPGAVWMGWEEWCEAAPDRAGPTLAQPGYWGTLAISDSTDVGRRLGALGLRDDGQIIVYADGPRTRGREGRIAWMLAYFGATNIALLDGGWTAWVAAGGAVECEEVVPAPAPFAVRLRPERRVTLADLRRSADAGSFPALVDTRSPAEFAGEVQEYLPRRGHLPGAWLRPFAGLFEPDGRYITPDHYLAIDHKPSDGTPLVAYCEVGVRAGLFAMLHEAHTGRIVPVYEGSLMEWAFHEDLPMETGSPEPSSGVFAPAE